MLSRSWAFLLWLVLVYLSFPLMASWEGEEGYVENLKIMNKIIYYKLTGRL